MDSVVVFRRDSISIAYTDGQTYSGSNFDVWYGYSNGSRNCSNMIINADIIKQEMKVDLLPFDHTCITVKNAQDIWHVMAEVGSKIFQKAIARNRKLLTEVVVENCYGDSVVVNRKGVSITCKFLRDKETNEVFFLYNNTRNGLFGRNLSIELLSCKMPISGVKLYDVLSVKSYSAQEPHRQCIAISNINIATNIMTSTVYKPVTYHCYTITCVEHFAHQLLMPGESSKCSNLHGHSYICRITVQISNNQSVLLTELDCTTRRLLKSAFAGACGITTCENIVNFLSLELSKIYKVLRIELKETDNIKVVKYFDPII